MIVLTKEDIKKCFNMENAIEAAKKALAIYTDNKAIVPLRNNIRVEKSNGNILYMPASTVSDVESSGIKIVSVYPDNVKENLPAVPATMILVDSNTGIVSAVLDGTYLTQLRTGAVQGAATDILANKNSEIGALIGTGGQAYQQAIAMLTVRKLKTLKVFSIDRQKAKDFVDNLQKEISGLFDTKIILANSAEECVECADIITTVTTSKTPTFKDEFVKQGAHINGVGAYTEDMLEMPVETIARANKIFFDTTEGVMAEAGDILSALRQNLITVDENNVELGNILLGNTVGRESSEEITLFKTVGTAVLDVVTAQLIFEKAKQLGIGTEIKL